MRRDPTARVALNDPHGAAELLNELPAAGAHRQADALAERVVTDGSLAGGWQGHVTALLRRERGWQIGLFCPDTMARLLNGLRDAGAHGQADALAERAAAHVALDGRTRPGRRTGAP